MKIGDRVICVDASNHCSDGVQSSLKKGRDYIVYGTNWCHGDLRLDVGIRDIGNGAIYEECGSCGRVSKFTPIHWAVSTRFRKVEAKTNTIYIKQEVEIEEPELN